MPSEGDTGIFFLSGKSIYLNNNFIGEEPWFCSSYFTEMYWGNQSQCCPVRGCLFQSDAGEFHSRELPEQNHSCQVCDAIMSKTQILSFISPGTHRVVGGSLGGKHSSVFIQNNSMKFISYVGSYQPYFNKCICIGDAHLMYNLVFIVCISGHRYFIMNYKLLKTILVPFQK